MRFTAVCDQIIEVLRSVLFQQAVGASILEKTSAKVDCLDDGEVFITFQRSTIPQTPKHPQDQDLIIEGNVPHIGLKVILCGIKLFHDLLHLHPLTGVV